MKEKVWAVARYAIRSTEAIIAAQPEYFPNSRKSFCFSTKGVHVLFLQFCGLLLNLGQSRLLQGTPRLEGCRPIYCTCI